MWTTCTFCWTVSAIIFWRALINFNALSRFCITNVWRFTFTSVWNTNLIENKIIKVILIVIIILKIQTTLPIVNFSYSGTDTSFRFVTSRRTWRTTICVFVMWTASTISFWWRTLIKLNTLSSFCITNSTILTFAYIDLALLKKERKKTFS